MRNAPGFTFLAVLVMALGIGANTAVFSVVNTVLLKPLAYRDADRIVTIRNFWKESSSTSASISAPDFHDWHDQSNVFEAMAYYAGWQQPVLSGAAAEYAEVTEVTPEFFAIFGVRPVFGRGFNPDEMKPKSGGAVVISAAYFQSHFGGNPNAIGQTVRIAEKSLPIVGVMQSGFDYPEKTSIWFPANTIDDENTHRSAHNYRAVGKLKPGVTVAQAQAQMTAIAARLEQLYPPSNAGKGVAIGRMQDTMTGNVRFTLYLLVAAVGVVLLIACANMANLLLANATRRVREMAIRAAVGTSRARIVRQLIVEGLALALVAGGAGLILAVWGVRAIKALAPAGVPRLADTTIDGSVLAFTFLVSVISSIVFGLAPALAASKVDLNESLKQGAAKSVIGGASGRLRAGLVVAEIALSVVLLMGAGLLMRSFNALTNVDLGFRPEKILVAETSVPAGSTDQALKRAVPFDRDMIATLAALPGVSSAGGTRALPGDPASDGGYWIDHLPPPEQLSVTAPQAVFSIIAPGAFQTLGIPVRAGRDFSDRDVYGAPFTVIINEALARKSFPGENPLGRVLYCGFDYDSLKGMTIVGIAGDVHERGPQRPPMPEVFMPYAQHPRGAASFDLLARTSADPAALADAVRRKQAFRQSVTEARERGQTVFLSSHILSEVEALCDRVAILRAGDLIEVGTLAQMRHLSAVLVEAEFDSAPPDLSQLPGVRAVEVQGNRVRSRVTDDTGIGLYHQIVGGRARARGRSAQSRKPKPTRASEKWNKHCPSRSQASLAYRDGNFPRAHRPCIAGVQTISSPRSF